MVRPPAVRMRRPASLPRASIALLMACIGSSYASRSLASDSDAASTPETAASREHRLRVRPYVGGPLPADMHVENRYGDAQRIPLYVGAPLFLLTYLESTLFALAEGQHEAVVFVPIVGSFASAAESFQHVGQNRGPHAVTSGILDGVLGVSALSNGTMQAIGLGLGVFGIAEIAKGPQPHLVPNAGAARVTLHPLFAIGGVSVAGLGISASWL